MILFLNILFFSVCAYIGFRLGGMRKPKPKEYLVILERPYENGNTEYKSVFVMGRNENEAAVKAFTTTPGIWDVYKVEEYIGFN